MSVPCTSGGRKGNGGALRITVQTFVSSPSFFTYSPELLQRECGVFERIDDQSAQDFRSDRMKLELKPGDDTKVAAAAANRPKQIGVLIVTGAKQAPIGRDHVGGQQIVYRHAVLSRQPAESTAEGESCDTGG